VTAPEFFTGINLVYIIGIISGIVSALWAYKKFLYEKKLEKFKTANESLFKKDKQEVLAAIATLGIFKSDSSFEKNTTDVLLSRLYTELDYDITNAIAGVLIEYSNRSELKEIADKLADINRNFFYQTVPVRQMVSDLNSKLEWIQKVEGGASDADTSPIVKASCAEIKTRILDEYKQLYPKHYYELLWHKQITADTYSRILRKASKTRFLSNRYAGVEIDLYQNEFNYTSLVNLRATRCSMQRSAICDATIADIELSNIDSILNTNFAGSAFHTCIFSKGKITGSLFHDCHFHNVTFSNIEFKDCIFWGSAFSKCRFENCTGLEDFQFLRSSQVNSQMPVSPDRVAALRASDAESRLISAVEITEAKKKELIKWLDIYYPPTPPPMTEEKK